MDDEYSLLSKEIIKILRDLHLAKQHATENTIKTLLKQNKTVIKLLKKDKNGLSQFNYDIDNLKKTVKELDELKKEYDFLKKQFDDYQILLKKRTNILRNIISLILSIDYFKNFSVYNKFQELQKETDIDKINFEEIEHLINQLKNEIFQKEVHYEENKKEKRHTLLKRLFEKEQKEFELSKIKEIIYQKFQHIISEINLPGYDKLNKKSEKFLNNFLNNFKIENLDSYLENIIELLQELKYEYQLKRNEIDNFLQELIAKLIKTEKEFYLYFNNENKENQESNKKFNNFLFQKLDNIKDAVQGFTDINDLDSLKENIFLYLDDIQKKIEEKNKIDYQRYEELQKELQILNNKLEDTQKELERIKEERKKIEKEILIDGLTGIYNRRAFDNKIQEIIKLNKRYNTEYCLIILDIDHFKKINDKYGHRVGDNALNRIVKNIKLIIRDSDFFARYGGEEFAIILPETKLKNAANVAEKIKKIIENIIFTYKKSETIKITISAGISELKKTDTPDSFIERADKALYFAKNNGRNQVATEENI